MLCEREYVQKLFWISLTFTSSLPNNCETYKLGALQTAPQEGKAPDPLCTVNAAHNQLIIYGNNSAQCCSGAFI